MSKKISVLFFVLIFPFFVFANSSKFSKNDVQQSLQGLQVDEYVKDVSDYWTKERMNNAIPMENVVNRKVITTLKKGSIKSLIDQTVPVPRKNYSNFPQKAIGKVFFVKLGTNYACSGSIIGKSTIITAGHCVSNGKNVWHTKIMFVPAYYDGKGPHGKWVSKFEVSFVDWHEREIDCRDVGVFNVLKKDGKTIAEVVGNRLYYQINDGYFLRRAAFGYPANSPYDGERMIRTDASFIMWTISSDMCRPKMIGIRSDQEGGASGGPWTLPSKHSRVNGIFIFSDENKTG